MIPTPFSAPAGFITEPAEIETLVMKNSGFQLRSCTLRIDCAAYFGCRDQTNTSAPEACSSVICEFDRGIGHFIGLAI